MSIDYLEDQERAYLALEKHARRIAKDCGMVAGIGDGNCGHIINRVIFHLSAAGLYKVPEAYRPTKKPISNKLRKQVFERDAYRCVRCGSHLSLEADHVFPECCGGEATLDNLQTLCKPCNMKKGGRVDG